MIGKLPQFLSRKKTLAVVGVLIVLTVGVGIRLLSNSEEDRETIRIAERLLNETSDNISWRFIKAGVLYYGEHNRTVRGIALGNDMKTIAEVDIEKQCGEWVIVSLLFQETVFKQLKDELSTFLP